MGKHVVFTEDEQDLLKELMNIAYGSATAVIADFLERFATLSIPNFHMYSPPELQNYLQSRCDRYNVYAKQPFNGEFSGETMFFLDDKSMKNIALTLNVNENEDIESNEMVLELLNILSSTLITRLASEMGTEVSFSQPTITKTEQLCERIPSISQSYTQVIIINTILEFEEEQIKGEIAVFTKESSLKWLHDVIKKMVAELIGS